MKKGLDESVYIRLPILAFPSPIIPHEKRVYMIKDPAIISLVMKAIEHNKFMIGILYIGGLASNQKSDFIGTICNIDWQNAEIKTTKDGQEICEMPVEGNIRFKITEVVDHIEMGCFKFPSEANIDIIQDRSMDQSFLNQIDLKKCIGLIEKLADSGGSGVRALMPPFKEFRNLTVGHLADKIVASLVGFLGETEKAKFLEILDPLERFKKSLQFLEKVANPDSTISARVLPAARKLKKIDDLQRLNAKYERIKNEIQEESCNRIEEELHKLETMGDVDSSNASICRNYLEFTLTLCGLKPTEECQDMGAIKKILNEDHYGLDKIKKRIVEYVAVKILNPDQKSPILCFVGPPGVGKTSLGKSISRALNRKFIRLSLGGVSDEAEIRGHKITYIGATAGRILKAIKDCGANNPLFMLDEIDKLGSRSGIKSDVESALLEVLDPEQNFSFSDNYVEIGYDLSRVLFILTANVIDTIPPALKDRLEILRLPGYSEDEKIHIARKFLLPRQLEEKGLADKTELFFPKETISKIIQDYTQESGVRNLEREIAQILRQIAVRFVEDYSSKKFDIKPDSLLEFLGPKRNFEENVHSLKPGVSIGLAWTIYGGEILFIESLIISEEGNGQLMLTGQLGDVMEESAKIALSYIRSRAKTDKKKKLKNNIHLHVPAGAVPKDGPSAGLAIAFALQSLFKSKKDKPYLVKEGLAVTGEITLRGAVLPVGGIKEKVIGAIRAGIKEIILPKKNEGDIEDLPENIRDKITFHLVEGIDEAFDKGFPQRKNKNNFD